MDSLGYEDRTMYDAVFHLIYLRNAGMVLSKKHYNSWYEIQDEYEDYATSIPFMSCNEIIRFFEEDFKKESEFPFSKEQILNFAQSDDMTISIE